MRTHPKADSVTMVLSPNKRCWSNPSSGTSIACSDLRQLSAGVVLIFRATDIFSPQGFSWASYRNDLLRQELGCSRRRTEGGRGSEDHPPLEGRMPVPMSLWTHRRQALMNRWGRGRRGKREEERKRKAETSGELAKTLGGRIMGQALCWLTRC